MTETYCNDFDSDLHRRVVGHLSYPRTVTSLVRELDADVAAAVTLRDVEAVERALGDCVGSGWVANVGDTTSAERLPGLASADPDAIDLADEEAETLARRAAAHPLRYLDAGDKFVRTRAGHAKLCGPVPDEPPPKTGYDLVAATETNARLAREALEAEEESAGAPDRTPEQLEAAREALARAEAAFEAAKEEL